MILPNPADVLHRAQMYRLLIEIADSPLLVKNLIFKGGTCAALLNELDRFSVDLDFDLKDQGLAVPIQETLEGVFTNLGLTIKDRGTSVIQYYLKYDTLELGRNTLKIDAINVPFGADTYEPMFLADIDRYMVCQTIETMFAHKLVAIMDRFEKHGSIAGRDIYDIHYFFLHRYNYRDEVIIERTGVSVNQYLEKLIAFISNKVTETVINEDLNMLLPYEKFTMIRKSLKAEVLSMLRASVENK